MHTANKQKKNLDFGLKPSKRLDDVTVLLIVMLMTMLNHGKHIYQYKVKVSEMRVCSSLCFVTISKDS